VPLPYPSQRPAASYTCLSAPPNLTNASFTRNEQMGEGVAIKAVWVTMEMLWAR